MNLNMHRNISFIILTVVLSIGFYSCAGLSKTSFPFFKQPGVTSAKAVADRSDKLYSDVSEDDELTEIPDFTDIPKYIFQPVQFLLSKNLMPFVIGEPTAEDTVEPTPEDTEVREAGQNDGIMAPDASDDDGLPSDQDLNFYSVYSKKFGIKFDGKENRELILTIDKWMGTPYKFGGCSKKGIDCSCLVKKIYQEVYGIGLHRTSGQIFEKDTKKIENKALKEGDIVSFKTRGNRISHIGIYLKDNKFVHTSRRKGVMISNLNNAYFRDRFLGAGRIPMSDYDTEIFALNVTPPDANQKRSGNRLTIKKLLLIPNNT